MISVAMVLHNEAAFVAALLDNVAPYTDDINIVLQDSTDATPERIGEWRRESASRAETRHVESVAVHHATVKGYADPDRTLALSLGKHPWTLMIDADERMPGNPSPLRQIVSAAHPKLEAFNLPMRSLYFEDGSGYEGWSFDECRTRGREVFEGYPDWHPRLVRTGTVWPAGVHQRPTFKRIANAPGFDMLHLKTRQGQIAKNERYATMFPEWAERMRSHSRYIESQLAQPVAR